MLQASMTTRLVLSALAVGVAHPGSGVIAAQQAPFGPAVEIVLSGDLFRRGDRVHVWLEAFEDTYVTVLRIDTDGRVAVLFPDRPWEDNFVPAGKRVALRAGGGVSSSYAFVVDDYPGQGYVFAITSAEPFDYRRFVRGDYWDYRSVGYDGHVTGDPYAAVMDLIDEIAVDSYAVSYDVYPYYVDRRYDYPRFLCYDCHEHVAYNAWNPYRYSCVRFRIVVYDDPYYYPARMYRGTRVVYSRPYRIEPRYVFKDRERGAAYVTTVRRRPADDPSRRAIRPDARRVRPDGLTRLERQLSPRNRVVPSRRPAVRPDSAKARPTPKLERRSPRVRPSTPARREPPKATRRKPTVKPAQPAAPKRKPPANRRKPAPRDTTGAG